MSREYEEYLRDHIDNVNRAFRWIRDNVSEIFDDRLRIETSYGFPEHDASKWNKDEYNAYDEYFYGGNKSDSVIREFNYAWLTHIHKNPHHWQHWVLINDDPDEGEIVMDMPMRYIIEMICDWWAFSWKKEKLDEIFSWYNEHKKYMKLSEKTRETVEDILGKIKARLDEVNGR